MNNELYDSAVAGDSTADTTSKLYDVDYSTTSNITEDVDFLTILTGILPNGNNIYNRNSNEAKEKSQATSDEKAEEAQDQNQTETHKNIIFYGAENNQTKLQKKLLAQHHNLRHCHARQKTKTQVEYLTIETEKSSTQQHACDYTQ
ncbi:hypothetical protein HMPREF0421_20362 [Gardnerella vaginalis ATCC 14019]|uniref:Uncharacterized protein n=1 Tax=Gardnerella vaginalis (strain ATCC 14019 / 317) TaxID=525284 RepID=E3D8Q0_GARV3|nr:hypothetical protein HMPREF0421_20362 [Gardnerella vaginalis ATCC 14019]